MMGRRACFIDRDGTLIEDRGYARSADQIALLPGAAVAIRLLNARGILAILLTNQSGIGRGLFTAHDLDLQHRRLAELLAAEGARLDAIYVCPHRPDQGCDCRKPRGALVRAAAQDHGLDLSRSFAVGDKREDVTLGETLLGGGLLVRTGQGESALVADRRSQDVIPDIDPARVHADLLAAVSHLLATTWAMDEGE